MNVPHMTKKSGFKARAAAAKAAVRAETPGSLRSRSKTATKPRPASPSVDSRSAACDSPQIQISGLAHNHCPRSGTPAQPS